MYIWQKRHQQIDLQLVESPLHFTKERFWWRFTNGFHTQGQVFHSYRSRSICSPSQLTGFYLNPYLTWFNHLYFNTKHLLTKLIQNYKAHSNVTHLAVKHFSIFLIAAYVTFMLSVHSVYFLFQFLKVKFQIPPLSNLKVQAIFKLNNC